MQVSYIYREYIEMFMNELGLKIKVDTFDKKAKIFDINILMGVVVDTKADMFRIEFKDIEKGSQLIFVSPISKAVSNEFVKRDIKSLERLTGKCIVRILTAYQYLFENTCDGCNKYWLMQVGAVPDCYTTGLENCIGCKKSVDEKTSKYCFDSIDTLTYVLRLMGDNTIKEKIYDRVFNTLTTSLNYLLKVGGDTVGV